MKKLLNVGKKVLNFGKKHGLFILCYGSLSAGLYLAYGLTGVLGLLTFTFGVEYYFYKAKKKRRLAIHTAVVERNDELKQREDERKQRVLERIERQKELALGRIEFDKRVADIEAREKRINELLGTEDKSNPVVENFIAKADLGSKKTKIKY